jgi:hypothetical protein
VIAPVPVTSQAHNMTAAPQQQQGRPPQQHIYNIPANVHTSQQSPILQQQPQPTPQLQQQQQQQQQQKRTAIKLVDPKTGKDITDETFKNDVKKKQAPPPVGNITTDENGDLKAKTAAQFAAQIAEKLKTTTTTTPTGPIVIRPPGDNANVADDDEKEEVKEEAIQPQIPSNNPVVAAEEKIEISAIVEAEKPLTESTPSDPQADKPIEFAPPEESPEIPTTGVSEPAPEQTIVTSTKSFNEVNTNGTEESPSNTITTAPPSERNEIDSSSYSESNMESTITEKVKCMDIKCDEAIGEVNNTNTTDVADDEIVLPSTDQIEKVTMKSETQCRSETSTISFSVVAIADVSDRHCVSLIIVTFSIWSVEGKTISSSATSVVLVLLTSPIASSHLISMHLTFSVIVDSMLLSEYEDESISFRSLGGAVVIVFEGDSSVPLVFTSLNDFVLVTIVCSGAGSLTPVVGISGLSSGGANSIGLSACGSDGVDSVKGFSASTIADISIFSSAATTGLLEGIWGWIASSFTSSFSSSSATFALSPGGLITIGPVGVVVVVVFSFSAICAANCAAVFAFRSPFSSVVIFPTGGGACFFFTSFLKVSSVISFPVLGSTSLIAVRFCCCCCCCCCCNCGVGCGCCCKIGDC